MVNAYFCLFGGCNLHTCSNMPMLLWVWYVGGEQNGCVFSTSERAGYLDLICSLCLAELTLVRNYLIFFLVFVMYCVFSMTEAEIHIKNFNKSLSIEKTQPPLIPSNPYNNSKMSTWSHPWAFEGGFDAHNFAPIWLNAHRGMRGMHKVQKLQIYSPSKSTMSHPREVSVSRLQSR